MVLGVALGCGGSDNPACESFSPCGGDPVGSWQTVGTCTSGLSEEEELLQQSCPDGDVTVVSDISGSLDIRGDGTYAFDFTVTNVVDFFLVPACLQGVNSCDQVDEVCTGDVAEGCRCSYEDVDEAADSDDWSTAGSVLDLDGIEWDYCVRGNRLTMRGLEDSTGVSFTVVLDRR